MRPLNFSLGHVYCTHRLLPTFDLLDRFAVLSWILFSRNEATAEPANAEHPLALQGPSWQKSVNVGSTHLEKRVWTLVQHTMEGSKTPKWAAPCSKPCTTTLKCLQPSLHEGCQKLHSNMDQDGKSLLSFRISYEMTKWHSRNPQHSEDIVFTKVFILSLRLNDMTDKAWFINAKLKLGSF